MSFAPINPEIYALKYEVSNGSAPAAYQLGCYFQAVGKNTIAFKYFKRAYEFDSTYALAISKYASSFINGRGCDINHNEAFRIITEASQHQLNGRIVTLLAYCYKHMIGCKQDLKLSFELYEKAALMGHAYSMYYLGQCWLNGSGTTQDKTIALFWKTMSAHRGCTPAQVDLGTIYMCDDPITALYYLRMAEDDAELLNINHSDVKSTIDKIIHRDGVLDQLLSGKHGVSQFDATKVPIKMVSSRSVIDYLRKAQKLAFDIVEDMQDDASTDTSNEASTDVEPDDMANTCDNSAYTNTDSLHDNPTQQVTYTAPRAVTDSRKDYHVCSNTNCDSLFTKDCIHVALTYHEKIYYTCSAECAKYIRGALFQSRD